MNKKLNRKQRKTSNGKGLLYFLGQGIRFLLVGPALILIFIYKYLISPFTPAACRHYPTCSTYAGQAIHRHGFLKGSLLGGHRILHCHPWGTQGYDPVPHFLFPIIYRGESSRFILHDSLQKKADVLS